MKSINKTVLLAVVHVTLLLAVFAIMPKEARAQRTVGVSVGDWADYGVVTSGNSSLAALGVVLGLGGLTGLEGLAAAKVSVTAISSPNITCQILGTYANSTQVTHTGIVDVDTGAGNATGLFIAANLNATDQVYTGGFLSLATINETVTRTYLGSSVDVNHFNASYAQDIPFFYNISMHFNLYWYRSTGVIAEGTLEFSIKNATSYQWENLDLLISSIVPEFPPVLILPLFMILSLVAVVLLKRRLPRKAQTTTKT